MLNTIFRAVIGAVFAAAALPALAETPEDILARILEQDGGPGVMAAVVQDGEVVWSGAAGLADLEALVPLTGQTPMRIGSVSKTLTAALVLRLAEQGRLNLDADLRELIPELHTPDDATVTARQFAAHISGMRQYDFGNYLEANNVFFHPSLTDANAQFFDGAFIAAPGEEHHYTSIGFNMLGIAVERASEMEFSAALETAITAPLSLDHTMIDHPLDVVPNRTRFYTRFPDGVTRNTIWRDSSDYYPSGGMLSTATDLARITDAIFSGEWLNTGSMDAVRTEARTASGEATGYTFGWQIHFADDGTVDWYGHGGETNGAYAVVRYYPEHDLTVAGIMNANFVQGEPVFFNAVSEELARLFMEE